jgi:3-oxoacyl-(acyl-carrier-protein) synthase/acyl carrier protein
MTSARPPAGEQSVDVAVIGLAGTFPGAATIAEFLQNLREGRDCTGDLSKTRRAHSNMNTERRYQPGGYLDRVDAFDHRFFGLSLREAELMDPQQRILLETICASIEHAGYALRDMAGARVALVTCARLPEYYFLLPNRSDALAQSGNIAGMVAGRIAYHLDLRGPAMVIDTGCSSSLVAVYEACRKLAAGEAEVAVVGAVNVQCFFADASSDSLGIVSRDGKCRPFDRAASGTIAGEGAASLVLKPLADAERDGDHVHAVIKGGAVNHDGQRSKSLMAPSHEAQAEVLQRAWRNAQVDGASISYIETHGTATEIGDPIEFRGLCLARGAASGASEPKCALGSVKSNIGHLDAAAGIASVVKTILSLQHRQLFPTVHFNELNPLIECADKAPFYVQRTLTAWETDQRPRRAGVSAFSLVGTNAHLVLEEALPPPARASSASLVLVKLSARTHGSLRRYAQAVKAHVETEAPNLVDFAFTLNAGRGDYEFRTAVVGSSIADIATRIGRWLEGTSEPVDEVQHAPRSLALLLSDCFLEDNAVEAWRDDPAFREALAKAKLPASGLSLPQKTVLYQCALYHWLMRSGFDVRAVVGVGLGRLAKQIIVDGADVEATLRRVEVIDRACPTDDRLRALAKELGNALVAEVGGDRSILERLEHIAEGARPWRSIALLGSSTRAIDAVVTLYRCGARIDWRRLHMAADGALPRRVPAPTYAFEPTRCWYAQLGEIVASPAPPLPALPAERQYPTNALAAIPDGSETQRRLAAIWRDAMQLEAVRLDDDFFDLGGHSLIAMDIIDAIRRAWNVTLAFEDFFATATIRKLDELIAKRLAACDQATPTEPSRLEERESYPLSHAQERLWTIDQLNPGSAAYNISESFALHGHIDTELLRRVLDTLVARHESLRTVFVPTPTGPVQKILQAIPAYFSVIDLAGAEDSSTELRHYVERGISTPFQLDTAPLFRVRLFLVAPETSVLTLAMHHIIGDGWSFVILLRELSLLYSAAAAGAERALGTLPLRYRDYAAWHTGLLATKEAAIHSRYWHAALTPLPSPLTLPLDGARGATVGPEGETFVFELARPEHLRALATSHGVSVYATLLALCVAWLHKTTGQSDIAVGTDVAGRVHPLLKDIVGFFVNTVVIRASIEASERFSNLLQHVSRQAIEAYDHQIYPFDLLVKDLVPKRDPYRTPLFDVFVSYQNFSGFLHGEGAAAGPALDIQRYAARSRTSRFDLELQFDDDAGRICTVITYRPGLFHHSTIAVLALRFQAMLHEALEDPDRLLTTMGGGGVAGVAPGARDREAF